MLSDLYVFTLQELFKDETVLSIVGSQMTCRSAAVPFFSRSRLLNDDGINEVRESILVDIV